MLSGKGDQKKLIHRFYPLLIVSLGLHGLALLIPLAPKPEPIVVEEFEPELKPITVSELPKTALPEADSPVLPSQPALPTPPLPPPIPPPAEVPQPAPQTAVQPSVAIPSAIPADPLTPDPDATVAPLADPGDDQSAENTTPQTFVPPDTGRGARTATFDSFRRDVLTFYPDPNGEPIGLKDIRQGSFGLNYTGDRCFQGNASVEGGLAVVIDKNFSLLEGQIFISTGYEVVDEAIDIWFSQLANPSSIADSNIEIANQDLSAWINDKQGPLFTQGEDYAAFSFETTVNLVNNTCP